MKICALLLLLSVVGLSVQMVKTHGTDCSQIRRRLPTAASGVYWIQPPGVRKPFQVYCEMLADGGWTVFQRRTGSTLSFRQNWAAYRKGFGEPGSDQWLGLERVYSLTRTPGTRWVLRVDLWDHEEPQQTAHAQYSDFRLANEQQAYRLTVGSYQGNAGDAIKGVYAGIDQNGSGFSTMDRDNDGCNPCLFGDILENHCARFEGGWWFSRCGSASLNGQWHPRGQHLGWSSGLHWHTWKGPAPYSVSASRMMIKSL
ncbi:unnamed protein product [Arctogadus glacialis]